MFLYPEYTTVSVVAASKDMTTLARVLQELGLSGVNATRDALLAVVIQESSAVLCNLAQREFASETLVSTYRNDDGRYVDALQLDRKPATSITSIVEDGVTLGVGEWELDKKEARLWKLSDDARVCFTGSKIVVTYVAGYVELTTQPQDLDVVMMFLVKQRWFSAARAPDVRSVEVPGVLSETYWVGDIADGAFPAHIDALINPYRPVVI